MYSKGYIQIIVVVSLQICFVKCELFTALVQLQRILQAEELLAGDLKTYIQNEREKLDKLDKIAQDYEQHSVESQRKANTYLANPINAYLLVKRLTVNWQRVHSFIKETTNLQTLSDSLEKNRDTYPDERDLQGAGSALLRLQDTYALHTSEIVKGNILGIQDSPNLTADDCVELGKVAYLKEDYYHCVMWMTQAKETLEAETTPTASKAEILDYLSISLYKQGNLYHAFNYTLEWLKKEPTHTRALKNKAFFESVINEELARQNVTSVPPPEIKNVRPRDEYMNSSVFRNYEILCQGGETHKLYNGHKLFCRYKHDHPYFLLGPLQEEIRSFRPWIGFYHNIISNSEIETVKSVASPKLHRSSVFTWKGGNSNLIQEYRTSKSAWLHDHEDPLIARLSRKAGAVSGLSLSTVEGLQVLNYGIGGHYEPHHDFARRHESDIFDPKIGNRIATVLFYMTDVAAGGATVFPQVGAKVFPKKGSCVMWFNLLKNGEGDYATQHAACPVVSGTKWVCNKWFHERGQEFMRPCDIDPDM